MRSLLRIARGVGSVGCALSGLLGCSSDSGFKAAPELAGSYTVSVTNGDNGCMIENWVAGKSTTDIPFSIEQQGTNLTGTLTGLAGLALSLSIGTNKFVGVASGDAFDITAYGSVERTQDACMYELNAEIQGAISGDAISGTISYAPATSNDPACASSRCSSIQNFNGTRPPS
jgi:hypothetical protein